MGGNYVRFVTTDIDENSRCESGLFQGAYEWIKRDCIPPSDKDVVILFLDWFGKHLPVPSRFRHVSFDSGRPRAICWFKPSARKSIACMAYLANILSLYNVRVRTIESRYPGCVAYEDKQQVVAVPTRATNLRGRPFDLNRFDMRSGQALLRQNSRLHRSPRLP